MAIEGWIKIHRQISEHPLFIGRMDRLGAFTWLVMEAAFRPRRIEIKGRIYTLERGQLSHSIAFIAKAWGWSKTSTARFLTRLETETMIGIESGTGQSIITICNYDKYQARDDQGGTASGTASGTRAVREREQREEGKNISSPSPTQSLYPDRPTDTDIDSDLALYTQEELASINLGDPDIGSGDDTTPTEIGEAVRRSMDRVRAVGRSMKKIS